MIRTQKRISVDERSNSRNTPTTAHHRAMMLIVFHGMISHRSDDIDPGKDEWDKRRVFCCGAPRVIVTLVRVQSEVSRDMLCVWECHVALRNFPFLHTLSAFSHVPIWLTENDTIITATESSACLMDSPLSPTRANHYCAYQYSRNDPRQSF